MKQNLKIAAATILYNPNMEVIDNIYSYIEGVDVIYVIDNSEKQFIEFARKLEKLDKVKYVHNEINIGIAKALNTAAQIAIDEKYDLLLTMDQDSKAQPKMIATMLNSLNDVDLSKVGIISPYHITGTKKILTAERLYDEFQTVMTSGNLLNLNAYQKAGPFNEELFIDCVDHDYCLRLIMRGYKVIRSNRAIMKHNLGNQTFHKFFGKTKVTNNHSPIRRYYIARNRLYMMAKYKSDFPEYYKASKQEIIKELKYIVLFEKDKFPKLKMMFKGFLDFKKGKMWKYND